MILYIYIHICAQHVIIYKYAHQTYDNHMNHYIHKLVQHIARVILPVAHIAPLPKKECCPAFPISNSSQLVW